MSRIVNPVAKKLFSSPDLYPLPNQAGTGALGVSGNYAPAARHADKNHQGDVKFDYRFSDKDTFSSRCPWVAMSRFTSLSPLPVQMAAARKVPPSHS